jgi:hypothetical protein
MLANSHVLIDEMLAGLATFCAFKLNSDSQSCFSLLCIFPTDNFLYYTYIVVSMDEIVSFGYLTRSLRNVDRKDT